MKQIGVHGQRVRLYSLDEGHTWSSSPQSIVAYGQRKKVLRSELQNSFARIDEMRDLDADNFNELDTPKSPSPRQRRKITLHGKARSVREKANGTNEIK